MKKHAFSFSCHFLCGLRDQYSVSFRLASHVFVLCVLHVFIKIYNQTNLLFGPQNLIKL